MKKHFNKNLIMSKKEEHLFQEINSCWICGKLIDHDDEKVRDHGHVIGKFKETAHRSCNINFQLTKKVPVIFHNLRGYDSHLIFFKLNKSNVKIRVIPIVFIDSMQFMNSSLDKLVKNVSDEDFKYLVEEFGSENLEILKQKGAYPYEYMNNFERFKKYFFSSTKKEKIDNDGKISNEHISIKDYLRCKKI